MSAGAWTAEPAWPGVPAGLVTVSVGVQCWGCGHRQRLKGTEPRRWEEVLCGRPGCGVDSIVGVVHTRTGMSESSGRMGL